MNYRLTDYWVKNLKLVFRAIKKRLDKDCDSFLEQVSGVIHVGANIGQERKLYAKHNLDVLWIEPIPKIFKKLKNNLKKYPRQQGYQYLVTDRDNEQYEFHIANNNGLSSSILNFDLHKDIWPQISYERSIILQSTTLVSLLDKEDINIVKYDALVMDTQGSELLVLKGAETLLNKFKYIKTEVSDFESYVGCCQIKDIEDFLLKHGFREVSRHNFASRKEGGNYYDIVYKKL
ncbi:FkbM family methyltransferase [Nostoc sp. MG11]|uniref:FkbM family methyltransferase n=1 Tax=Nostoc sp. MG11 TaxID=2721166 RepID=UPI0018685ED6|nr:FkbM family methyltransferase [Nostoc sp. MG11]